ncbi:unnamed protein product [Hyaloperonospora brassicae]|uniref:RED-like N-terminal domain-containing protein n=1 Tax=Hyaloperonospora brassicae TaxID=162125 RepID=A0AAV0UZA2_HYABA|nr:unnamed protein product [Hyaloperonospora brassicae]
MNQDDFRQMLASRTPPRSRQGNGAKRNFTETELQDVKKLMAKKGKKKSKKSTTAALPSGVEGKSTGRSTLYRDRAAERRTGSAGDMIDAEAYKHVDVDESKFLGGDMEHTHLVKGLDYALLAQLRREKQKLQAEKIQQVQSRGSVVAKEGAAPKSRDGTPTFKTRMGRMVYFYACQSTPATGAPVNSDLFLPGRMYYTFPLSSAADSASVPVSVQRSKEDCPEPDDMVSDFVDELLIERVKQVMTNRKQGNKMRKKKRNADGTGDCEEEVTGGACAGNKEGVVEDAIAENGAATTVDDDEDIFPDVGEHVPIDQRIDNQSAALSNKEATGTVGYFENLSASITEKERVARKKEEDAERLWKETLQKAVEAQKKVEQERAKRQKEAKMTGGANDYAEYQDVGVLEDSDEEDDEETSRRRKAAGLSGNTVDADRKKNAHRKQQKQSSKLANDLEKINEIMKEKSQA